MTVTTISEVSADSPMLSTSTSGVADVVTEDVLLEEDEYAGVYDAAVVFDTLSVVLQHPTHKPIAMSTTKVAIDKTIFLFPTIPPNQ